MGNKETTSEHSSGCVVWCGLMVTMMAMILGCMHKGGARKVHVVVVGGEIENASTSSKRRQVGWGGGTSPGEAH
jgi:hypothetical protein